SVDFVPDAAGYAIRASALEPFRAPEVEPAFTIGPGYQLKVRASSEDKLVVGYLRNISGIKLHKIEGAPNSRWKVSGAYIRTRSATPARLRWRLLGRRYALTVWDLDTGEKKETSVAGQPGSWEHEASDHDYLLLWRQQ
ncbi:MAG: hypothetical protein M3347_10785, partial [Armatimonadota bacterium]|nr:hypothetical protein [Armatimonadota bacterium]